MVEEARRKVAPKYTWVVYDSRRRAVSSGGADDVVSAARDAEDSVWEEGGLLFATENYRVVVEDMTGKRVYDAPVSDLDVPTARK